MEARYAAAARRAWSVSFLLLPLVGCLTPAERVAARATFDPVAAEQLAGRWLERHDPAHPQYASVRREQAAAAFATAEHIDAVVSWKLFRSRYGDLSEFDQRALAHEATCAFRDQAATEDTSASYAAFLAEYPDAEEASLARRKEAERALAEALARPGTEPLRAFSGQFAKRDEARDLVTEARSTEMDRALQAAEQRGTTAALREWLQTYGDWFERPDLVLRGHELADESIAADALRALLDGDWDDRALEHWAEANAGLPKIRELAHLRSNELLGRARQHDSATAWWVASELLAEEEAGEAARSRALELAFEEASSDAMRGESFVRRFPGDPRAWDVEGRWLGRLEQSRPRARWATVQRKRTLPGGVVELTVDVVDCAGERLAGLTADAFTLFDGDTPVPIDDFASLESDRPLAITVAVDLSGSMAVERAAVDAAVGRFAETLRFRNRTVDIGLVAFSDGIVARHAPGPRAASFRSWLQALPQNLGGGAGEDSAAAMVEAAELVRRSPGERVVITLTDEPLQVNYHGLRALGLKETPCDGARAVAGCLGACDGDSGCVETCVVEGPGSYGAGVAACSNRLPAPYCLAEFARSAIVDATRCAGRDDHPELTARVAGRLQDSSARSFGLVPEQVIGAFTELAALTGGRVVAVPDDARVPAPYEAALMDIADQLSKQYVVRYSTGAGAGAKLRVRPDWGWAPAAVPWDASQGGREVTLGDRGRAHLRVASDGRVERSLDGESWREVLPASAGRDALVVAALDTAAVCTTGVDRVYCSTDRGRTWFGVAAAQGATSLLGSEGGLFVRTPRGDLGLSRVLTRDLPASALYFDTNSAAFDAALEPFLADLAARLETDDGLLLRVEGHADSRGSEEHNEALALRRAEAVAAAVQARGGETGQVIVEGFGERRPVRAGTSERDHTRNRRVELVLVETRDRTESTTCENPALVGTD